MLRLEYCSIWIGGPTHTCARTRTLSKLLYIYILLVFGDNLASISRKFAKEQRNYIYLQLPFTFVDFFYSD